MAMKKKNWRILTSKVIYVSVKPTIMETIRLTLRLLMLYIYIWSTYS